MIALPDRPRTRLGLSATVAVGLLLAAAPAASAHGVQQRSDPPIPDWLFVWGAAIVLIVSFVALAVLWPTPRWQDDRWRPLPEPLGRLLGAGAIQVVCGAIGVAVFGLVVWAGLAGIQVVPSNFATIWVFVLFWVGLIPLSVVFGDVFHAFNPWRAMGRLVAWIAGLVARGPLPAPLPYPERLGNWPAAIGIAAFGWLELAAPAGRSPQSVAIAALIYSALTFVAMALYGVDRWIQRGEAFSVYFNLFSRFSPFERRDGVVGIRKAFRGLTTLEVLPGTVALLAVLIGTVTLDGALNGPIEPFISLDFRDFFNTLGLSVTTATEVSRGVAMLIVIALIYGFYMAGIAGARSVGGGFSSQQLARAFVHSLIPIALVYNAAHYFSFLLYEGQRIGFLVSNPLGRDWNVFGTADWGPADYTLLSVNTVWYIQVAFVVVGHVIALTLAHDRALAIYDNAKQAVRSQYWMLGVMVGFTGLALWLLSQAGE